MLMRLGYNMLMRVKCDMSLNFRWGRWQKVVIVTASIFWEEVSTSQQKFAFNLGYL